MVITVNNVVGVDMNMLDEVRAYPNPASGVLFIDAASECQLYMYNILGEVVRTERLDAQKNMLDVSSLSEGVYILKIEENNAIKNIKITIK